MSTTTIITETATTIQTELTADHGLCYSQAFLSSLPTSSSFPTLSAAQFDGFHHSHIVSHPPDSVLFPFLHGLEGGNEAQNAFFATQAHKEYKEFRGSTVNASGANRNASNTKPPKYRGMMWVICEDDLENPERDLKVVFHRPTTTSYPSDSDSESYLDEEEDDELLDDDRDEELALKSPEDMDVDVNVNIAFTDNDANHSNSGGGVMEIVEVGNDAAHMHPVKHKHGLPTTANKGSQPGDTQRLQTTQTEPSTHNPTITLPAPVSSQTPHTPRTPRTSTRSPAPILTSTFRASELLTRVSSRHQFKFKDRDADSDMSIDSDEDEDDWEFTPLIVPDGISLRNFGIQVAILATLSDIVIYSPNCTGAGRSPNAIKLAKRFRKAIEKKRQERITRMASPDVQTQSADFTSAENVENSAAEEDLPLRYNVFLLDAHADDIRTHLPHLVARLVKPGEVPASLETLFKPQGTTGVTTAAANTTTLQNEPPKKQWDSRNEDAVMADPDVIASRSDESSPLVGSAVDSAVDSDGGDPNPNTSVNTNLELRPPNTVDFAQRERDEMRDLIRASEIITVWPMGHPYKDRESERVKAANGGGTTADAFRHAYSNGQARRNKLISTSQVPEEADEGVVASPNIETTTSEVETEIDLRSTKTFWDPRVGQVFLGNAEDVPLPVGDGTEWGSRGPIIPELEELDERGQVQRQGQEWHANNDAFCHHERDMYEGVDFQKVLARKTEEREKDNRLGDSSISWSYNVPMSNAPSDAHGYDICIECVDGNFIPYPAAGHLKAIEEKINMLEDGWRSRCERERDALILRRKREREQKKAEHSQEGQGETKGGSRLEDDNDLTDVLPPRPAPHPNSVIHLSMPSSGPSVNLLIPVVRFFQSCLQPPIDSVKLKSRIPEPTSDSPTATADGDEKKTEASEEPQKGRRWSSVSVSSLISSFPSFPLNPIPSSSATPLPPSPFSSSASRLRALTTPNSAYTSPLSHQSSNSSLSRTYQRQWSRPLKILFYSQDGYTESSVPALSLLMAVKKLDLPQAYLELQIEKKRSFFVYQVELGFLRRVQDVLGEERWGKERERKEKEERERRQRERDRERREAERKGSEESSGCEGPTRAYGFGTHVNPYSTWATASNNNSETSTSAKSTSGPSSGSAPGLAQGQNQSSRSGHGNRPAAKSVSFAHSPVSIGMGNKGSGSSGGSGGLEIVPQRSSEAPPVVSMENHLNAHDDTELKRSPALPTVLPGFTSSSLGKAASSNGIGGRTRRPRASTSPWLPSLFGVDHHNWFNDSRFDGSFPSRILPFLYLGNLNHASNVYMLQALGITHVVSVGECALVPPANLQASQAPFGYPNAPSHFVPGRSTDHQGSLWVEERAGRMKVLDIQNVCDDGIDTLEPQLEPICDWIDQARKDGGQVLVHCRVGVSRSATVVIAYVMKYLSLSLVDAYLIVRSRRLTVLIQPNMRLLYNLLGWEIKLAKERVGGDERKLRMELENALTWPFLAKEIHALNEKYLE
ncbi:hypothetical protein K435DRAFT_967526 [Dendrothele bispora CBS 962.96]|uniref:Uncharacterized protein n=1 Tax=Dendrothele bispora (strain CBS 962.96) TaxID=1314807 RepID=A0A4S8LTE5_DENBC|nr:hypothetical protein K435DRAFT_967526 [Dendrothele bispora CBS 962.96]